ncbi:thioredoxin family protein [Streptomyces sp. NPDC008150]|uniref:thioredoxin family protein n=1 Tax=Streptomyces sp. NPDC008150 TaxID=3364816 RepID=UPI0036EEDC51
MHRRTILGLATALTAAALAAGCSAAGPTATAPASRTATPAASAAATPSPAAAKGNAAAGATTAASGEAAPGGYDATRDAGADIRAALARAAADHREVLLDFGADWCPDCRALDVMFGSAKAAPVLAENYVRVAVDVGRFDHNLDVAGRYVDLETSGIPALVVLKADGTVRTATNDGSFADAHAMNADQVAEFLGRWAPDGDR